MNMQFYLFSTVFSRGHLGRSYNIRAYILTPDFGCYAVFRQDALRHFRHVADRATKITHTPFRQALKK